MKTIKLFFAITMLSFFTGNAQITEGNWMVGGSAFFSSIDAINSDSEKIQTSVQLSINPNIGYFFFDKFAFGIQSNIGYGKTKSSLTNFSDSSSSFNIGPYTRYYFLKSDNIINVLTELNFLYGSDFNSSDYVTRSGFKIGPVLYFNNSVALELLMKYERLYISTDKFRTNVFQIGLGFQIHLEKK